MTQDLLPARSSSVSGPPMTLNQIGFSLQHLCMDQYRRLFVLYLHWCLAEHGDVEIVGAETADVAIVDGLDKVAVDSAFAAAAVVGARLVVANVDESKGNMENRC